MKYRYEFEDGFVIISRGIDKVSMNWLIQKHGKLIKKRLTDDGDRGTGGGDHTSSDR